MKKEDLVIRVKELEKENKELMQLKFCLKETLWMAARYAHNRQSVAVSMFNEVLAVVDGLGFKDFIKPDQARDGMRYATDAMFGIYNPETNRYDKTTSPTSE